MFKRIGIGMAVFMVAVLSIFLFCSQITAQEKETFSDNFEEPSMEGYEYQDVLVADGVLWIDLGGYIFRSGNWSNPSFSFKMRTDSPSNNRIKYHNSDEGCYSIDIFSDFSGDNQYAEISLGKVMSGKEGIGLFSILLDNFIVDDWNTIEVSFYGSHHRVIMNDQTIFTAEEIGEPLKPGTIGFMVEAYGSLEIDDFLINIPREVLPAEGKEGQNLEEGTQGEVLPAEGNEGQNLEEGPQGEVLPAEGENMLIKVTNTISAIGIFLGGLGLLLVSFGIFWGVCVWSKQKEKK